MKNIIYTGLLAIVLVSCNTSKTATETQATAPKEEKATVIAKGNRIEKPTTPTKPALPAKPAPKVKTMLVGKEDRTALEQPPFGSWYNTNYARYKTDDALIPEITEEIEGVTITTFMGTWCGDSKRETPRMFKILDNASFSKKDLTLITVDRTKKKPTEFTAGNNIIRVPTFIFKKDGKEIGRIVERPVESLEADMLKILKGESYKHAYEN